MQQQHLEFSDTGRFTSLFLDYLKQKPELAPFYGDFPLPESFQTLISKRVFDPSKRPILVEALHRQYANLESPDSVRANIDSLLLKSTFTITTGHQLNLCTGPLYFIYKIVAAISMANALKSHYPQHHFVPVYWMATEDHDFEEINHFRLFGKKYEWLTEQHGPVGRMTTTDMQPLLESVPDLPEFIKSAYLQSANLTEATRKIVMHLFGKYGLVIIDGDDRQLKRQFSQVLLSDLHEHDAFRLSGATTAALEALGYKGQVFPREINLFFMEDGRRERIEKSDKHYAVLNTSSTFDSTSIHKLVEESPEKLSPNVILRPLYQETILPNLAYIGGPAELAYWLQLKPVFDHYKLSFPALVPRLFAMIITRPIMKKLEKLNLTEKELFEPFSTLKEMILRRENSTHYDLSTELDSMKSLFESIKSKAGAADKTLEALVMGEHKNAEKILDHLSKRIKRAEEQKHEITLTQLQSVLDKLFPEGNLQEREDNFLNFYLNNPRFIDELVASLDPFDFRFNILKEDAQT